MTAIVILAAGSSSRFGSAKQNLVYGNQTLLQNAVKNALAANKNVIVVLGANCEDIAYTIKEKPVNILYNTNWSRGMATSIVMAIEDIQTSYLNIDSTIFMLCDQPFVDEKLLQQLIDTAQTTEKGIVASEYNNTQGVPALFKQKYFPYLLALKGIEGARKLLLQHVDDLESIPFPLGSIDIDTAEDWERLNQKETR